MKHGNLVASIAAVTVLGFAMGLTFPLISLQLESRSFSSFMIGLSAASQPLGTVAAVVATPRLVRRFGSKPVALACAVGTALILAIYPLLPEFWTWCVLRFLQGLLFSALFAVSEAWVVTFAPEAYRSRILAIYMSAFAGSLALGPMLVAVTGSAGSLPFLIGAAVLLVAAVPISLVRAPPRDGGEQPLATRRFVTRNLLLVAAVAAFALTEVSSLGLLPVYGLSHGLTEGRAALLASAFVGGPILFQFPMGWLADKLEKRKALLLGAITSAMICASLPFIINSPLVWPLLMALGTTAASLYTISLAMLGERYSGQELVTGTAVISAVYGTGSFLGSTLSGSAMGLAGPIGLPLLMTLVLLALALQAARG